MAFNKEKFLNTLQKEIKNEYASIVKDGIIGDLCGFVDSGSYLLNALISGSMFKGIPNNKVTLFSGPEGVGKSFILLSVISLYLKNNKNAVVAFFESESAQRKELFETFDIDTSRVFFLPVETVQMVKIQGLSILNAYADQIGKDRSVNNLLLCLDSLGNLSTTKELGDASAGKEVLDMTRTKEIKAMFRTMTLKMGILNVPFLSTNHTYMSQASMYPTQVVSGGSGPKYNASTSVVLSKTKEKDGQDHVGNIVHCCVQKSRFTKENSKCDIFISFTKGLNRYYGLLEMAVEAGMIKYSKPRFEFPSGEKVFKSAVFKNPDKYFTQEFLEELDIYLNKKFSYGNWNTVEVSDDFEEDEDDEIKSPFEDE